ncbi:MAG: S-methyl-5-thioribose kinase [Geminicoccaceae bacterium]
MALETPEGYRALTPETVPAYLAGLPSVAERLGGEPGSWVVREVGDGNLNLVFIVEGPSGDLCLKQALPYVRLVGDSWPLPVERAFFESNALAMEGQACPERVPQVFHYDQAMYAIVMERLSPHIIMRRGMIDGVVYPRFAEQISDFLAATLFETSDLAIPAAQKKEKVALFSANTELCKITEDLIFTDPYMHHERNRWTSPQLDEDARRIREDDQLKRAVAFLKQKFMTETQALLHGDMHTGSIMVTADDTKVIDPEFAFYGPMGFDIGKLIGNFLLCYFSQDGHEREPGERNGYRSWILDQIPLIWSGFAQKFRARWDLAGRKGDAFPQALFEDPNSRKLVQDDVLTKLFTDCVGYAGTSMIRRTLGLAHNIDMEEIEDPDRRAACERKNLTLARELIVDANRFTAWEQMTERAKAIRG